MTRYLIFTAQRTRCYDSRANHLPPVERRTSKPEPSTLSHNYCCAQTRQWRDTTATQPHHYCTSHDITQTTPWCLIHDNAQASPLPQSKNKDNHIPNKSSLMTTQTHPHYLHLCHLLLPHAQLSEPHTPNSIPVVPAAVPADQHWYTTRWCVISNETYSMAYVAFS